MNQANFASRLYILRTTHNLSQKQLAHKVHISDTMIMNYERGHNYPTAIMICKLADYFKVSTDYLLGRSEVRNVQPAIHKPAK